jgi:AcrR family transcriptional regulator
MSRRGPSRRPRAERAREILAAARAFFSEHGYQGASITTIARRAGVVEGTIYKHFRSSGPGRMLDRRAIATNGNDL